MEKVESGTCTEQLQKRNPGCTTRYQDFQQLSAFQYTLSEDPKELKHVPKWYQEHGFDQFFTKFLLYFTISYSSIFSFATDWASAYWK